MSPKEFIALVIPIWALAANVVATVVLSRLIQRMSLLRIILFGFFAGVLAVVAFHLAMKNSTLGNGTEQVGIFLLNLLTYIALGYGYFHFINLGTTARRIRIILELKGSGKGLSREELLQRYSAREIVSLRLKRLLDSGQVMEKDGRYLTGNRTVLTMAKLISDLKKMLFGTGL